MGRLENSTLKALNSLLHFLSSLVNEHPPHLFICTGHKNLSCLYLALQLQVRNTLNCCEKAIRRHLGQHKSSAEKSLLWPKLAQVRRRLCYLPAVDTAIDTHHLFHTVQVIPQKTYKRSDPRCPSRVDRGKIYSASSPSFLAFFFFPELLGSLSACFF